MKRGEKGEELDGWTRVWASFSLLCLELGGSRMAGGVLTCKFV